MRIGLFGVFFEVEQGLTVLDFLDLARVSHVALDPQSDDSLELLGISLVLSVEGVIVVILAGSGTSSLEGIFAVLEMANFSKKLNGTACVCLMVRETTSRKKVAEGRVIFITVIRVCGGFFKL